MPQPVLRPIGSNAERLTALETVVNSLAAQSRPVAHPRIEELTTECEHIKATLTIMEKRLGNLSDLLVRITDAAVKEMLAAAKPVATKKTPVKKKTAKK